MPQRGYGRCPLSGLRVLQVTTSDISLQFLLRRQLDALRAAGHEVILASASGPDSERLQREGFEFHELRNATPGWDLASDRRLQLEVYQLIRRLRPDVVHTHVQKTGVIGRIAARAAGVPRIVNTQHGLYARPDDGPFRKIPVYALERLAAACSHVELVQNPEDLAVLRRLGVPRRRLVLLGNGVDLRRFHPPSPAERAQARAALGANDEVVVAGIGRLLPEKGWREFAAAIRGVTGARGVLGGPLQPQKAGALNPRELEPLTYLGMVDQPERVYWAADILVMPSWGREGLPRAAIEASACGLPVVGADARGVRQVVDDGVTGFLHPVRDADRLRRHLVTLVADAGLRASMGAAARRRAQAYFDEDAVIERVLMAIEGRPVPDAALATIA